MAELTEADLIWNRACGEDPSRSLPGDCALSDLFRAHGLAMNGGVLHAIECLSADELANAQAGYLYYGFAGVASLLSRARKVYDTGADLDRHEQDLDRQYADLIPSDDILVEYFEKRFQANPLEFAPLREKDIG